jgi:HSP20 family protein
MLKPEKSPGRRPAASTGIKPHRRSDVYANGHDPKRPGKGRGLAHPMKRLTNPLQEVIMASSHLPSIFTRRSDGLGSLFREIERSFEDFSRRSPLAGFPGFGDAGMMPKIDVSESKDAVEVTAELPGCNDKDIDVTLSEGVLTIRGEKKTERDETSKDRNWHVVERSYGSFARTVPLPFTPDSAKVEAKFDNGVLRVKLPKPAEVARREKKIEITGGGKA